MPPGPDTGCCFPWVYVSSYLSVHATCNSMATIWHCFQLVDSPTAWCNITDYLGLLRNGRMIRNEKGFRASEFDSRITSYYTSDASPSYIIFPEVARLMGLMLPTTKFIAMLREPVSRAWSGYLQSLTSYRRDGDEHDVVSFGDAVELEIGIIEQCERLFPDPRRRYTDCIWPYFTAEVLEDTLRSGASSPFVGKAGFEQAAGRCTAGMLRKHSLVIRGYSGHGPVLAIPPGSGLFPGAIRVTMSCEHCWSSADRCLQSNQSDAVPDDHLHRLYYYQVKMWLDQVGRDRLHVVYSESYFADPEAELRSAIAFITGVEVSRDSVHDERCVTMPIRFVPRKWFINGLVICR